MTTEPMTPPEQRLAGELRAYCDRPGLLVSSAAVASDVTAWRTKSRRRGLTLTAVVATVLLTVGGFAGLRQLDGMASQGAAPASATVDGLTYSVSVGRGLDIEEADLAPIGHVSSTNHDAFAGDKTAFAIGGVPPDVALIVRADPKWRDDIGPAEFFILWRNGAWTPDGLCPYMDPHSPATPDGCREAGP